MTASPTATTVPDEPTSVTAQAGNKSAVVSWTAPSDGGSPITKYTVTPSTGGAAGPPISVSDSPPATSVTVRGLDNLKSYTFTVTATNEVGAGPPSSQSNAITPKPPTEPDPPTGVTVQARDKLAVVS